MPDTADILKKILDRKRQEIEERKAGKSTSQVELLAKDAPGCRGFYKAIVDKIEQGDPAVIAEIKKASPSRGVIRADFDPAAMARSFEKAGAACLSVLTDSDFFQGSDTDLEQARAACNLPVLRKEFIIDPYQVFESRAMGADCVLLIVAALDDLLLKELAGIATGLGMDVLAEVHNREELERALMLRTPLIGINNRDLHTFETTLDTTLGLLIDIMNDRTVVTESGIHTSEDIRLLRRHDVNAFLIGEAFMAAPNPGEKLKELFSTR